MSTSIKSNERIEAKVFPINWKSVQITSGEAAPFPISGEPVQLGVGKLVEVRPILNLPPSAKMRNRRRRLRVLPLPVEDPVDVAIPFQAPPEISVDTSEGVSFQVPDVYAPRLYTGYGSLESLVRLANKERWQLAFPAAAFSSQTALIPADCTAFYTPVIAMVVLECISGKKGASNVITLLHLALPSDASPLFPK